MTEDLKKKSINTFYRYLTGMSKMDNSTLLLESTFQDFLSHKYMDDDDPIHFNMTGPIRYNMTGYPSGKDSLERLGIFPSSILENSQGIS